MAIKEMNEIIEDNKQSITIVTIISMIFIVSGIFIITQNPEDVSGIIIYLLISFMFVLFVAILEFYIKKLVFPDAVFFGNSKMLIYGSVMAGMVFSGALGFASMQGMSIAGHELLLPIQSLTAFSDLGTMFALDVAPVAEAFFFRGVLFPSLSVIFFLILQKPLGKKNAFAVAIALGMILSAYIFAVFHFNVWLNQTGFDIVLTHDYISMGTLFGVIWTVALLLGGIGFELGSHSINNALSLVAVGQITMEYAISNLIMKLVLFVLIVEGVYRTMGGKK